MKRILIINPFGIGDVIFSTPLVEILKNDTPGNFIGYMCNKRAYEAIKANPNIDRIFVYEKDDFRAAWNRSKAECAAKILGLLKDIGKERFGIVIDLSLSWQYSMFLKLIGVRRRIGLNYKDRGIFLTDKIDTNGFDTKHVVEYYLDVLRPLGINVRNHRIEPKLYIDKGDSIKADGFLAKYGLSARDTLIGLIPGCGASWGSDAIYRRWKKENFADVADRLIEKCGVKVVLFGDPGEVEICLDIQAAMKNSVVMLAGKTTIGEFMGLLAKCNCVITNDGGPLHMAVGLGVNTVSIFGPVDEKVYGPYAGAGVNTVVCKADIQCRPCYRKFKYRPCYDRRCLDSITVEDVLSAAERIIRR